MVFEASRWPSRPSWRLGMLHGRVLPPGRDKASPSCELLWNELAPFDDRSYYYDSSQDGDHGLLATLQQSVLALTTWNAVGDSGVGDRSCLLGLASPFQLATLLKLVLLSPIHKTSAMPERIGMSRDHKQTVVVLWYLPTCQNRGVGAKTLAGWLERTSTKLWIGTNSGDTNATYFYDVPLYA